MNVILGVNVKMIVVVNVNALIGCRCECVSKVAVNVSKLFAVNVSAGCCNEFVAVNVNILVAVSQYQYPG